MSILTRSAPEFVTSPTPTTATPTDIQSAVDERGFYLYEWISQEELRMTIERDYLQIVRWASIPLAVVTVIAGVIGAMGGVAGTLVAVLSVLGIFYMIVSLILIVRLIYRSYLYTRGANVAITDSHYIQGGSAIRQDDTEAIRAQFGRYETIFEERFLGESRLAMRKSAEKKALYENLSEIITGGGGLLSRISNSRDSGGIIMIIMLAGVLYGVMMAGVYVVGIFFIALIGRICSWLAHRVLLMTSHTEHQIQTLFGSLDSGASELQRERDATIQLLSEASAGDWREGLSGRIDTALSLLSETAGSVTDQSKKLHTLLTSSAYQAVFDFAKYQSWTRRQILAPIESILLLLGENHAILTKSIRTLDIQIRDIEDPSLQKPLILQRDRLTLQQESFEKNMEVMKVYRERLL